MLRVLLLLIYISFIKISFSQGCSDAGACSIESINFEESRSPQKSKLNLNLEQTFSLGEKFVFISQTTVGIQYRAFKSTIVELRVPFIFTSGNLGNTSGVGDLILSVNQQIISNENNRLNLIVASRLKSNDANKDFNDIPLPMAYQTSLGTYDLIVGNLFSIPKWDFYVAWQHSFGKNKNRYLVTDNSLPDNQQYYESNKLKRGDDIYLRSRRFFELKNDDRILINTLFIYRIQKDEIVKNDENIQLEGSNGLTINLAFTYSKKLKHNRKIDFSLAFPIVDKAYRADGLTRNIVLGLRIINL